jgi:RNA polymerase sigma factor (sigma-70 family)
MASPELSRVLECLRQLPARQRIDSLADQQLLARFVTEREEDAFTVLLQRHGPMVVGVCRRLLRETHDVEDAFQATFLVLARKAASIRKGESVGSWLHGVALRVARKIRLEAARRSRRERARPAPAPADTGDDLTWGELRSLLDEELGRLPAGWRAPLILCYLEGRTQDEAARQLGWSKSTLRRRLERGRRLLQSRLARRGVTLSAGLFAPLLSATDASAALPRTLAAATVKTALSFGGGQAVGAARPVALAEGVLRSMAFAPGKLAAALLLTAGLLAVAGLGAGWAFGDRKPAPPAADARAADLPGEEAQPAAAPRAPVDQLGDPLPADALARLGTIRFRHGSVVTALTFAPDGRSLASAGHDGTIHIWATTTGKELLRVENHEFPGIGLGAVGHLAYSPDGKTLAGTRLNQPPCLWDVATGKELRQFGGPANRANWLAFSPEGKYLAYGRGHQEPFIFRLAEVGTGKDLRQYEGTWLIFSPDGKTLAYGGPALDGQFRANPVIRVAEVSSGKELYQFGGHKGGLAAFSPDGKTLASADRNWMRFFDLATGRVRELPRPEGEGQGPGPQSLIFSPDGKTLAATGRGQKTIRIMEVATGKTLSTIGLTGKREQVKALLFTHDSKRVLCAHEDGYVRFWDAATGAKVRQFRAHDSAVSRIALSPDGKTLATTAWSFVGGDSSVRLWETATGKPLVRHPGPQAAVRFLAFSPDSRRVAGASFDGAIHLWEAATGKLLRRWEMFGPLAFLPDGQALVRGGWQDGEVRFLDPATGKITRRFLAHAKGVLALDLSRDGKLLATAGGDACVRLWDLAAGRVVQDFGGQQKHVAWHLALSADAKILVSVHEQYWIRLWETATGKLIREYQEAGNTLGMALSPDGKIVASSCRSTAVEDQFIRLRDVASGQEVRRLPGNHLLPLEHLAFSPDGRTLIAGGQQYKNLYLGEIATGQLRRQFSGHQGELSCVAFSPDGQMIASGSHDGSVLLWDVAGRRSRLQPGAAPLRADQLDSLWTDLAARDAVTAYRALCTLRAAPRQAAALLERHLKPVPRADAKRVAAMIRDLGSAQFTVRQQAMEELEAAAEAAEPAVRHALAGKPSEEVRRRLQRLLDRLEGAEELRRGRALEVLEQMDSPEARRLLTALAQGAPGARLTRESQAALDRMGR